MIQDPTTVIAFCSGICAAVLLSARTRWGARVYSVIPSVVLIYYLPTICSSIGLLPTQSPAYDWMRDYLLPFSLFVLMMSWDLPSIARIGPKAIALMLVGSAGIVIGGPVAYLCFKHWLPPDSWKALAALSGSWIGGAGNFAAVKEAVGAPDGLIGSIIVVDTAVGYTWTGILLFLVRYQDRFDRLVRCDTSVFEDLSRRMQQWREQSARPVGVFDVASIVALGLLATVGSRMLGEYLFGWTDPFLGEHIPLLQSVFSSYTWMVIVISTTGILLSFTRIRRLETAGASQFGYAALYIFLTSLGAKANPAGLLQTPVLLLVGATWILVHILILVIGARLLKAPLFLLATASQANIGGVATAPIVAAAYYEGLAPVGVLMAVMGYLLGNYLGLLCAMILGALATM